MKPDPIIAEIRAGREEFARRAGYDMDRLCEMLRENQQRHGIKGVDLSQRLPFRYPSVGQGKALA